MGDRAVLTFDRELKPDSVGVYLHWQGDPAAVRKILDSIRPYARTPDDPQYAMARLIEACCRAEGAYRETGCGVGILRDLDCDNGDNGLYVIGDDWRIIAQYERPEIREAA